MFEGTDENIGRIETAEDRRLQRTARVQSIKDKGIRIVHFCCCCGRKLETHWDSNFELDGGWMALEVKPSDIFHAWVGRPMKILCNNCFSTGIWKKKN